MLSLNVSSIGKLYCVALTSTTSLNSVLSVIQFGQQLIIYKAGLYELTIINLIASTDYNIYCSTESINGKSLMPLNEVILSRIPIKTACCHSIVLSSLIGSSLIISNVYSLILTIDSIPTLHDLNINVTVTTCTHIPANDVSINPFLITFNALQPLKSRILTIIGSNIGCYFLSANSIATNELNKYYSNSLEVNFYENSKNLLSPKLKSAQISNDGINILVTLDSNTNQANQILSNVLESFQCSLLLNFKGSQQTSCLWLTTSTIQLYFNTSSYSNIMVEVNDTISLKWNTICAESSINCVTFSNSNDFIYILAPISPIIPIISLSIPSQSTLCDNLIIDATASIGNAGRNWKLIELTVESTNRNITELSNYLMKYDSTFQLFEISNKLLNIGNYKFTLILINYLNQINIISSNIEIIDSYCILRQFRYYSFIAICIRFIL